MPASRFEVEMSVR